MCGQLQQKPLCVGQLCSGERFLICTRSIVTQKWQDGYLQPVKIYSIGQAANSVVFNIKQRRTMVGRSNGRIMDGRPLCCSWINKCAPGGDDVPPKSVSNDSPGKTGGTKAIHRQPDQKSAASYRSGNITACSIDKAIDCPDPQPLARISSPALFAKSSFEFFMGRHILAHRIKEKVAAGGTHEFKIFLHHL